MAGRPRKPKADKVLAGTYKKCRNPEDEAEYKTATQKKAPDSLNKYGKWLWDTLSDKLIESGVLTEADWPAFEIMCIRYGNFREIHEKVKKDYAINIANERGQIKAEIRQMNADHEACFHLMQAFGLDPVSRNKFGVKKPEEMSAERKQMQGLLDG